MCIRDSHQDGQVGQQVLGGPAVDRLDLAEIEDASRPLVRQRRVDVAVADHDGPALEGGLDHRIDVMGLVSGVEQRLGAG